MVITVSLAQGWKVTATEEMLAAAFTFLGTGMACDSSLSIIVLLHSHQSTRNLVLKDYHMHMPIRADLMGRKRDRVLSHRSLKAEMLALSRD